MSGYIPDFNLTEQDIIDEAVRDAEVSAKKEIKEAKSFGNIIAELYPQYAEANDKCLSQMGFTEPYSELVKYVPRRVINQEYHDFTTFGNCPSCGKGVQNCMGHGPKKCDCGQMLKW
jgi:hypothetical protein